MPTDFLMRGPVLPRGGISGLPARSMVGAHKTRQSKYDARAARRGGDWRILEFPAALLWFDEACAMLDDEGACLPQPINDIWS